MTDNTPLPLADDPFGSFIQHDLDLDELTDETDADGEEAEGDRDTVDRLRRRFGSRPFATPPVMPPLSPRPPRRGWHVIRDNLLLEGLLLLTMLLIILTGLEQERTVNDLKATIAA